MYPLAIVKDKGGATRMCLFYLVFIAADGEVIPNLYKICVWFEVMDPPQIDQPIWLLQNKSPIPLKSMLFGWHPLQVGLIALSHKRICCSKILGAVENFKSCSTTAHPVSLWLRNQCGVQKRRRNMLEQQPSKTIVPGGSGFCEQLLLLILYV